MNKVALVTGASSGIGLDTCLRLIQKGYTVYGAARRIELMKEIEEKGGNILRLDLCDEKSIEECVKTILDKEGKIDVLVNNAGFGLGGGLEDVPIADARNQFEVNVFGLISLTQKVLPSMRNQRSGKIINISSMAGRFATPFSGWYHGTKYCVEALSDSLRLEVAPFGIKVVIIEPGLIQTDWGVIHGKNIRKYSGSTAYKTNANLVADYYEARYVKNKKLSPASVIAKQIVKASEAKHPKRRYIAGTLAKPYIFFKWLLSDRLFDKATMSFMHLSNKD
ncbi:oxidoreductase [Treponema sp.]|uniref:oxidoreductase n=1 Tax=Treponema sp. TaxID=166 RepID=UPI00298DC217|nr:oxidoreductase [Treponema sp.]